MQLTMSAIVAIFALVICRACNGFNIQTETVIAISAPSGGGGRDGSYCGSSVALNTSSLFVGAPTYGTSGAAFRCDFRGEQVGQQSVFCTKMNNESERERGWNYVVIARSIIPSMRCK